MAETPISPNNKSITFRGKPEREMTDTPKPETRMNAEDQATDGPKKAVKRMGRGVRKKANVAIKRGMISEKAAKKHLGGY